MTGLTPPVLQLDGVSVQAAAADAPVALLRDISFSVMRGRTLGLVGESGAGKSMIGRVVSGLLPAGFRIAHGRMLFEGNDLTQQPTTARRALLGRRIAFVPQEPLSALDPLLRVGQQFGEHLARLGVPARIRAGRAAEWLEAVHLPEPKAMLRRYPYELSGGQCQRVLIAMAVSSEPHLIIADEPTTALDVITQARIMQLLKEQQALHGAAMLLITHDLHMAAAVCDEVGVMYAGDMVEHGPAGAVLRAPLHPYTAALRNSVPVLHGPRQPLPSLPGEMPGLAAIARLRGCRFAPRCPRSDAGCADEVPQWRTVAPGHRVRCTEACLGVEIPPGADLGLRMATPRTDEHAVLELDDVCLSYNVSRGLFRQPNVVGAVQKVSLRVAPGEFVGLVGESGSGKTSIARLVMGLARPTSGRITLITRSHTSSDIPSPGRPGQRNPGQGNPGQGNPGQGNPGTRKPGTHNLGTGNPERGTNVQLVFQDPQSALNPRRSVLALVTQALEVSGQRMTAPERFLRAEALLRETGLPADCLPRVPSQLSGGQRQRVNIARALCVTPELLVADEIVSGLDVSVQAQILNLLLALGRDLGISLLFISHDLAAVRYLCTRVAVMHRGEIVEIGETDEVFANPRHDYTRRLLEAVPSAWSRAAVPPYLAQTCARSGESG